MTALLMVLCMLLTGMANFPYISANFNKVGELVFDPYVIKEWDGINYITGTLGGVIVEEYADPYGQERIVAVDAPKRGVSS